MGKYITTKSKYAVGAWMNGPCGDIWRYVKVGNFYFWKAWNGMAKLMHFHGNRPDYIKSDC